MNVAGTRRLAPPPDAVARLVAFAIAALLVGVTIRSSIFSPWGTDSAAYIRAAHGWAQGEIFRPASLVFWAPWSAGGQLEAPLGDAPGSIRGTNVSAYPLGYPVLLATALKLGGPLAVYVVGPLLAGLLAWCAYLLGAKLAGPWAGVGAASLVAVSPVTLEYAVHPMSDVPAVALWALGWVMALRPGRGAAMAAGAATAMAVTVRPNLAPLAFVTAAVVVAVAAPSIRERFVRVVLFGVVAVIGPLLVLWSNAVLYGNPLQSGYGNLQVYFNADRVDDNLVACPTLLVDVHGWLLPTGLLMVPLALMVARRRGNAGPAIVALAALGVIVVNGLLYLPFFTCSGWRWLRFMLPALLMFFVLFAAMADTIRSWIARRSRALSVLAVVPLVAVAMHPWEPLVEVFQTVPSYKRPELMGRYLREVLPPNAIVMVFLQSGAAALHTGKPVLRLDLLGPDSLDGLVDDLRRHGFHPVFVIDELMEKMGFFERFPNSRYRALDWPARAEFWSGTPLWYLDPADRVAYQNGERWPVDIIGWTPEDERGGSSVRHVPDVLGLPPVHEILAFRRTLEFVYRDQLGRGLAPTAVDLESSVAWTRRYLRYRMHGCTHPQATGNILEQVSGGAAPRVCQDEPAVRTIPPRDEQYAFRQALEDAYRQREWAPETRTYVDLEGDAVWTHEYLKHRLARCSHAEATERVLREIEGQPVEGSCADFPDP